MTQGTLKETKPLEERPPIAERSSRKGIKLSFLAGGAIFIAYRDSWNLVPHR